MITSEHLPHIHFPHFPRLARILLAHYVSSFPHHCFVIHCEPWNPPEIVVSFKKEGERVARGYFHETPDDGALGALDDMKIVAPADLKRLFCFRGTAL